MPSAFVSVTGVDLLCDLHYARKDLESAQATYKGLIERVTRLQIALDAYSHDVHITIDTDKIVSLFQANEIRERLFRENGKTDPVYVALCEAIYKANQACRQIPSYLLKSHLKVKASKEE